MITSVSFTLLEIASLLSPVYAKLTKQGLSRPLEMKHRWIAAELVGQRSSSVQKNRRPGGRTDRWRHSLSVQVNNEQTDNKRANAKQQL